MAQNTAGDAESRVPAFIEPMLATPAQKQLPDDPRYAYEFKWDGYRAVMRVATDGTTRLTSRNDQDFTRRFPILGDALGDAMRGRQAALDGEIVALGDHGRPDFGLLQNYDAGGEVPVPYFVFDVLLLGGDRLLDAPCEQRRTVLERIEPPDRNLVAIPPSYSHADLSATGMSPHDLLDVAKNRGLEGLMVKAISSTYHPGRRSPEWIKHPLIQTLEVVVCGWRPGQGRRDGMIGALLLGAHDPATGGLAYIGDVGTGFSHQALMAAREKLAPLARKTSPFAGGVPQDRARGANWVTPKLVGEVVYRQFTPREHRLRHTAWRGWRPDKNPADVAVPVPD
ncbi:non-homologous end-joining DNA ligase [Amycolatopsis sp. NPDC051071]|uniref:non-homologous end-joining DNA ligase n=1 Tax=Amycolatopsis sp. NPDC051071 TaxID=3154637 RepID=UPI0034293688